MFIKKIQMKDYKRFHDLTIDLGDKPKRIIALVGPNGCGKSSVFDAMLFLANKYSHIGNGNNKDYHYHSLNENPSVGTDNIIIQFDDGDFYSVYDVRKKLGKEKSIFSFRSSFRYNSNLNVTQTMAVDDLLKNNYGATTASDIDQRIEENYRRLLAKFNNYRDKNDLRPSEAKSDIIGELNDSLSNCLDLRISSLGNVEEGKGTFYFKKSDSPIEFDFNVLFGWGKRGYRFIIRFIFKKRFL